MNPEAVKTNKTENLVTDLPFIETGADVEASVSLEDLSRLVGEGGHEPSAAEWVDIPLCNAIWRRPRCAAQKMDEGR